MTIPKRALAKKKKAFLESFGSTGKLAMLNLWVVTLRGEISVSEKHTVSVFHRNPLQVQSTASKPIY